MKLPKKIFVYWMEEGKDERYLCAVTDIGDIPEERNGEKIGHYTLTGEPTFTVKRELS